MYEVTVHDEFCAAHALVIAGKTEPVHGHNFRVTVTIAGQALDASGLLCDFHAVERALTAVIDPFRDAYLNDCLPFDHANPSAERIARHIADQLTARLDLPRGVTVCAVTITEAPGCRATYKSGPTQP